MKTSVYYDLFTNTRVNVDGGMNYIILLKEQYNNINDRPIQKLTPIL
jgi:hypothetical protein